MRITKLNDDGSQGSEICISETEKINSTKEYSDYYLSCSSDGEIDLEDSQGLAIEIFGLSQNKTDKYSLMTGDHSMSNGASRIEIELK